MRADPASVDQGHLPDVSGTAGQRIAGRFQLVAVIGRGAMGTVWRATDQHRQGEVAIKMIAREHLRSRDAITRFEREARAVMRLRSRFAVRVFEHGKTDDDVPYTVMELLEGETLEDHIDRRGPMDIAVAVRYATQVARALSRAHKLGIVHRDLKPANVFLATSGKETVARVLDFGIAKVIDPAEISTTHTGAILGTPEFMSPEQIRGLETVDKRSDLFSLGMVVFNMLAGVPAHDSAPFGELLLRICTAPLPKLREAAPSLPEALDGWFERACARQPEDRFQKAQRFAEALHIAASLPGTIHDHLAVPDSFPPGTHSVPPPPQDSSELPTIPRNPIPRLEDSPPPTPAASTDADARWSLLPPPPDDDEPTRPFSEPPSG